MKQKKLLKKVISYVEDNRGMSLVTVIITIGFVAILASILLMTSLINFKMKQINVHAKDSFYSAEQVLDEINIGLQRSVSDGLSSAYTEILTNYAEYDTERKNEMLQTKYYEYLWNVLGHDAAHKTYDTSALEGYLKTSTKWHGDNENGYGAVLQTKAADGTVGATGVMVTYDKNGIILKDLTVYYKDINGYVSKIKTDIRLAYPDFNFAAATALPDVPSYSFIADKEVSALKGAGGNLEIDGNVYADSVNFTATTNKLDVTQASLTQFIVKHEMELQNASFSNAEMSEIWAGDIVAQSSNLTLLGESNVADDIDIKGDESTITLGGAYNGFGNSLTDAGKSSAILVNGTNATLDMSRITRIQLSGHAYVGVQQKKHTTVTPAPSDVAKDVYTGESLAVKSNQLMYLVPAECIGVSKETGKSMYQKNPLTTAEYNSIHNKTNITEISTDVEVEALGGNLSSYITMVDGKAKAETLFVPTSDPNMTLVYYYMNFPDEDAANNYFAKYYAGNKDSVDQYIQFYTKEIKFPNTESLIRLRMAGNALKGNKTDGFENQTAAFSNASEKFALDSEKDAATFMGLCTGLVKNLTEMSSLTEAPSDTDGVVFENITDQTKFDEFIALGSGNTRTITNEIDGKDCTAVVTKGSYTVNDSKVHLVIAKGDVTVNLSEYTGTIVTDGKIIMNQPTKMTADEDLVRTMLHYTIEKDGTQYPVASVFKGGSDLIFASLAGGEETDGVTLSDLVVYENWTKE